MEILGFDCTEPPCLAMLRPPRGNWWDDLVNLCPQWVDHYGSSVSSSSQSVTCGDGSKEHVQLLGWSRGLIDDTHPMTDEETENATKRFRARIAEAKAAWRCASDG